MCSRARQRTAAAGGGRGPNDACCCRADQPSAQRDILTRPLAAEAGVRRQQAYEVTHIIASDSPLRLLPPGVDPIQTLFIDGIRHAAEVADLAYIRLASELTQLALSRRAGDTVAGDFTAVYMHAWSVVDAVDRLRGLFHLLPGAQPKQRTDGKPSFRDQTEGIRSLRNVSDHLAQRVEYVVASGGTALGTLTWLTVIKPEPLTVLSCAIVPGTLTNRHTWLLNPADRQSIRGPSDRISLTAGEYSVDLTDIMVEVRRLIASFEAAVGRWIKENGHEGKQAGGDLLLLAEMAFVD